MGEMFREFFHLDQVPQHTADLMPWSGLRAPGILDCKDQSYLTSYQVRGPDQESALESEIGGVHWQMSNVLKRLLAPSAVWYEMRRIESLDYPPSVKGSPLFARMSDEERRRKFQAEGVHFDSEFFMTLGFRPPSLSDSWWERFLVTHSAKRVDQHVAASLEAFQALAARFVDLLKLCIPRVTPLEDEALLRYLKYCCTMRDQFVRVPNPAEDLDWYLADRDLLPGFHPILVDRDGHEEHLRIYTIRTFPDESIAGMTNALEHLDFKLRFVSRFLPLTQVEAEEQLKSLEKKWLTTDVSIGGMLSNAFGGRSSRVRSSYGEVWAKDTDAARQENFTNVVGFGRWTGCVVLCHHDLKELDRMMRAVEQVIHGVGLGGKWETLNAEDAWCGTMPGHWEANVIQPILHTLNKAQLEPISAPWGGVTWNDHLKGPPLFYAQTHGHTPFRVDFWHGDVGSALFEGPIGSGKSTNVLFSLASFVARHKRAQGYILEVGASGKGLTYAMGGQYFDLGSTNLMFQPLRRIGEDEQEQRWAHEWICDRVEESGHPITPEDRNEIWRALSNLGTSPAHQRTMTGLQLTLQSRELREALRYYTIDGPHGLLLDADTDGLPRGTFQGFDVKALLDKARVVPAVLTYIIHRIEGCLDGSPTVVICDDFAKYFNFPVFLDRLDNLFRLRRKDNLAVWMSTQTGADITGTKLAQLILDSCMTRLLFPNPAAMDEENDEVYRSALRMNMRQRRLIARAERGQFYFDSPKGSQLCTVKLDGLTLAVCGASSDQDRKLVDEVYAQAGPMGFLEAFATAKGLAAEYESLAQEVNDAWSADRDGIDPRWVRQ